jgi:hypothetical protein
MASTMRAPPSVCGLQLQPQLHRSNGLTPGEGKRTAGNRRRAGDRPGPHCRLRPRLSGEHHRPLRAPNYGTGREQSAHPRRIRPRCWGYGCWRSKSRRRSGLASPPSAILSFGPSEAGRRPGRERPRSVRNGDCLRSAREGGTASTCGQTRLNGQPAETNRHRSHLSTKRILVRILVNLGVRLQPRPRYAATH